MTAHKTWRPHLIQHHPQHWHSPGLCSQSTLIQFPHTSTLLFNTNFTYKFGDDIAVVGMITNNNEVTYREEVQALTSWCQNNDLLLNTSKTKKLVIDLRKHKKGTSYASLIDKRWNRWRASDTFHLFSTVPKKKWTQKLFTNFYECTTESVPSYGCVV